jgi:hypothetical protein
MADLGRQPSREIDLLIAGSVVLPMTGPDDLIWPEDHTKPHVLAPGGAGGAS